MAPNLWNLIKYLAQWAVALLLGALAVFILLLATTACESPGLPTTSPCVVTDTSCIKTLPCRSCVDNCGQPVPVDSVPGCTLP